MKANSTPFAPFIPLENVVLPNAWTKILSRSTESGIKNQREGVGQLGPKKAVQFTPKWGQSGSEFAAPSFGDLFKPVPSLKVPLVFMKPPASALEVTQFLLHLLKPQKLLRIST